jgi:hypothetical protein
VKLCVIYHRCRNSSTAATAAAAAAVCVHSAVHRCCRQAHAHIQGAGLQEQKAMVFIYLNRGGSSSTRLYYSGSHAHSITTHSTSSSRARGIREPHTLTHTHIQPAAGRAGASAFFLCAADSSEYSSTSSSSSSFSRKLVSYCCYYCCCCYSTVRRLQQQ